MRKFLLAAMTAIFVLAVMGCNNLAIGPKHDKNYLTFRSSKPFTLGLNKLGLYGKGWNGTLEYSTDKATWTTWDNASATVTAARNLGNFYVYLRGKGNTSFSTIAASSTTITNFTLTGANNVECIGNIMMLLDYENPDTATMSQSCFASLFNDCTALITAPELPATKLADSCYMAMFQGCKSLIEAPDLPATTLAIGCYESMFHGCTALMESPELPATTLANACYQYMFQNCTELFYIGKMGNGNSVDASAKFCCKEMFNNCQILKISGISGTAFVKFSDVSNTTDMFKNTGGIYKNDPVVNTQYYFYY